MTNSLRMARLLNVMNAFREDENEIDLSVDEERILGFIHERNCQGVVTTVSDIVVRRLFGTPPTVQRKIDRLFSAGMLIHMRLKSDLRKRNLVLTDRAVEYLHGLSDRIDEILKGA